MVTKGMQKIVLLKDIPSNIVEEAIIILKDNKLTNSKAKSVEFFDSKGKYNKYLSDKEFAVKEAQNVVSEYIKTLEGNAKLSERGKFRKEV